MYHARVSAGADHELAEYPKRGGAATLALKQERWRCERDGGKPGLTKAGRFPGWTHGSGDRNGIVCFPALLLLCAFAHASVVVARQASVAFTSGARPVVSWNWLARVPQPLSHSRRADVRFAFKRRWHRDRCSRGGATYPGW